MTLDPHQFGFGITGAVPDEIVRGLAPLVEQAGFRTLWINHTAQGNALASIEVAAAVTSTLRLATGVISVDLLPASDILRQVRDRDLPLNRLVLGIGASKPPSPLRSVREAANLIHDELPGVPVYVGALGPKMRALGARETEGLLLNWLTPAAAKLAMADRRADAPDHHSEVALYIRCSLGDVGREAMATEAGRYAAIPSYAANFERLGFSALDAAITADTPAELSSGLARFQGVVDEPVLRAITGEETLAAYASLVDAFRN